MEIKAYKTGLFKAGGDLPLFIKKHLPSLKEGSIVAVSSKAAGLWEGRTAPLNRKEEIIKRSSDFYLKTSLCYFTVKDGMVMTNAGVDESNCEGGLSLLPERPYKTAERLRKELKKIYGVKKLGVILTDSMILPLRAGVISAAVGYAGFRGIKDYRGKGDIFGRKLKMTMVDIADTLAAAAGLLMGEGKERKPFAVIEDAPVVFSGGRKEGEIKYPLKDDLYYPFFKPYLKKR